MSAGVRESVLDAADVLTVQQAAEILQCGEKVIRRLCRVNRLRHVRLDGRGKTITTRRWVAEYLERASRPVAVRS